MSLKPVFIAALAATSLGASLLTAAPAFADELRCGSSPGANNYCNTDTSRGVTLLYQHSSYGCYQNDTWGYDRSGIWVSNGCSATFRVGNTRDREEDNTAVGLGILALGILGAATQDQGDDRQPPPPPHSSYPPDPYQQGQGQYQGGYNNQDDDEEDDRVIISCNSKNNKYKLCPVRIQGYVELVRQKSRNSCRFNKSWGYDRRGVWVNKGCRAEFAVY